MRNASHRIGLAALLGIAAAGSVGATTASGAEPVDSPAAMQAQLDQLREQLTDTQLLLKQAAEDLAQLRAQVQQQNKSEEQAAWSREREELRRSQAAVRSAQAAVEQQRQSLKQLVRVAADRQEELAAEQAAREAAELAMRNAPPLTPAAPPAVGPLVQSPPYSVWAGNYGVPGYWGWPYVTPPFGYAPPYYGYGYGWWPSAGVNFPSTTSRAVDLPPGNGTTLFNASPQTFGGAGTTLFNGGAHDVNRPTNRGAKDKDAR